MFLVEHQQSGFTHLVFLTADPRADGYKGPLTEGVSLDYDMMEIPRWSEGQPTPNCVVGMSRSDPKKYKVFKYRNELEDAGYDAVAGSACPAHSWSDYTKSATQS